MHFVDTAKYFSTDIESYLKRKENAYLKQLNEFISGNRKKEPEPKGWANSIVQKPLSECFKENCGYCGVRVLFNSEENEGDIDHFNPKSLVQSDIFKWSNYVWSCKTCNQQKKKDYFDTIFMIFDPTKRSDCALLDYNEGRYYVKTILDKLELKKQKHRLHITGIHTRINSQTNISDRKSLYISLKLRIESLIRHKKRYDIKITNKYDEEKNEFKEFCRNSSYKFLISEIFFIKLKNINGANILDNDVFQF